MLSCRNRGRLPKNNLCVLSKYSLIKTAKTTVLNGLIVDHWEGRLFGYRGINVIIFLDPCRVILFRLKSKLMPAARVMRVPNVQTCQEQI